VWASWISKEKEIQVSSIQHRVEQEKLDAQKKREWELALAQFVITNKEAIYDGTPAQQRVLAMLIPAVFPADVSATFLERLEKTSTPPARAIWSQARMRVRTPEVAQTKEAVAQDVKASPSSQTSSPATSLPSTFPNSFSNDSSNYGFSSLLGANRGILSNSPTPSPFEISIGSSSAIPRLSDIVYRPSPTPEFGSSYEIPRSLSLSPPYTPLTGPSISGTIIDAATGLGIPNATIELESRLTSALNRVTATTDDTGKFSINVPSGIYMGLDSVQIKVAGNGYKATTKDVNPTFSSILSGPTSSSPISLGSIALEKGFP